MTTDIIIGNLLNLGAMISDSVSGTRKKHSEIMAIQIVSQFFYGAGSFVLKGYSSTAQNVVAVFRNLAAMKDIKSKALEWVLILGAVILGICVNNRGIWGWLPIIANFQYSIAVFSFKDNEKALKISFTVCAVMFTAFSVVIKNYVGIIGNTAVAVTTVLSLIRGKSSGAEKGEEK